jgi:hypothetical protein
MPGKAMLAFGFPDVHWCNRDQDALSIAMKCHASLKPDITVIGGDVWDATPFCRFGRTPGDLDHYRSFAADELLPVSDWFGDVERNTKRTVWLEGNHDNWIDRWLANLPGVAHLGREMIRLPSDYIKEHHPKLTIVPFTPAQEELSIFPLHENLVTCHGWACSKFAARRHLELSRTKSIIFHHTHRAQTDVTRDPHSGKIIEASSCGCLCKLVPIWKHGAPTDWVHGFWIAYLGRHTYTLFNIRIERGRAVLPDGTEVRP